MSLNTYLSSLRSLRSGSAPEDLLLRTVFILIPLLGGCLSFVFSDCSEASRRWRSSLSKSSLSPPTPVVATVWVVLYTCMGHASYCAYVADEARGVLASGLVAYLTQCLLNHFFMIVLFGLQRIDLALLMIIPLWCATALTTVLFYDVDMEAAMFMLPVLLWVSFYVYLNCVLFLNNPVYTELELRHGYRPQSAKADADKGKLC